MAILANELSKPGVDTGGRPHHGANGNQTGRDQFDVQSTGIRSRDRIFPAEATVPVSPGRRRREYPHVLRIGIESSRHHTVELHEVDTSVRYRPGIPKNSAASEGSLKMFVHERAANDMLSSLSHDIRPGRTRTARPCLVRTCRWRLWWCLR